MTNKKIVYLDMDDTISTLLEPWIDWLNKKHNLDVKVKDIKEWDMSKAFPTLTSKELYEDVLANEEFWPLVEPVKDAQYYIKKLQEDFDVYVVTATDYRNIQCKVDIVLKRLYPDIPLDHLIFTYRKDLLNGFVMVDDYDGYLKDFKGHKILINEPYNRDAEGDYIRVDNWEEIWYNIKMLDELERNDLL